MSLFFFFNDTATTEIYTLSLHDALPISTGRRHRDRDERDPPRSLQVEMPAPGPAAAIDNAAEQLPKPASKGMVTDRKSTRLNSSHANISYAVFCLKKKTKLDARETFKTL